LLAVSLFIFIVLPLGVIEGQYGRFDYSGDAIPYLDMARAVHDGQWKLAFNPLWGLGYSLLIAGVKPFFAATAAGEWNSIRLLNLLIFTGTFASFFFLLRTILSGFTARNANENRIVLAGTALFLSAELCMDNVSRVGPDLLVTTLVLLALALLLRLLQKPGIGTAVLLGAVLGAGYVTKTIFLPLSLIIVVVAAAALYRHHRKPLILAATVVVGALFAIPYAAGLSWAMGRFTLGESGTLNYAWHVNRLSLMHWQGGPAQFGQPLHPTKLVLADPPIYSFSEPFHVTYPPFFNPPYFYEGYKHFFSATLQLRAIAANCFHLVQALRAIPMAYAVILSMVLILFYPAPRREWLREIAAYWPILLPALAGIALYLQVHLEGRYLPAFLLVLALVPLSAFFAQSQRWPSAISSLVLAILLAGSVASLWTVNRTAFADARRHYHYSDSQQWMLAKFLAQHGLQPGDGVAIVGGPATHCTWAYVDHLRIVSELAADVYAPQGSGEGMFWNATPAAREHMFDVFANAGAKLVVVPAPASSMPGWMPVPGTDVVVRDLPAKKSD
jgi:hypothetical protein